MDREDSVGVHVKEVFADEAGYYSIANTLGLTPKLLSMDFTGLNFIPNPSTVMPGATHWSSKPCFVLKTEKYPMTIYDLLLTYGVDAAHNALLVAKKNLKILHLNGIIHNDIHLKNFVTNGIECKIIDFGLSTNKIPTNEEINEYIEEYSHIEPYLSDKIKSYLPRLKNNRHLALRYMYALEEGIVDYLIEHLEDFLTEEGLENIDEDLRDRMGI